jgi:hypothetical protein
MRCVIEHVGRAGRALFALLCLSLAATPTARAGQEDDLSAAGTFSIIARSRDR